LHQTIFSAIFFYLSHSYLKQIMNKKGCFYTLGILVLIFFLYVVYIVTHIPFSDNLVCTGIKTELNLKTVKVDQYLKCPNGVIGFINTSNSNTPIIFKKDKHSKLLWAYILESDSCSGIPFKKMGTARFEENDGDIRITFFNHSHSEPGIIYLDDQYNFKSLYLSPF
jgi:hypothetical protein